jgi:enamine deaminase RidA (YjgF/YER057c/UK114 family)
MTAAPTQRLSELGITLPPASPSPGAFVQSVIVGDLAFTSGQIAVDGDNGLIATGKVGAEVDVETARACARQCAINVLAQLQDTLGGLERIERVVKLTVFVASAPSFTQQSAVANGASELIIDVLGEAGAHTRSAIGVAALPFDSPVEVEATVQLRR